MKEPIELVGGFTGGTFLEGGTVHYTWELCTDVKYGTRELQQAKIACAFTVDACVSQPKLYSRSDLFMTFFTHSTTGKAMRAQMTSL